MCASIYCVLRETTANSENENEIYLNHRNRKDVNR